MFSSHGLVRRSYIHTKVNGLKDRLKNQETVSIVSQQVQVEEKCALSIEHTAMPREQISYRYL